MPQYTQEMVTPKSPRATTHKPTYDQLRFKETVPLHSNMLLNTGTVVTLKKTRRDASGFEDCVDGWAYIHVIAIAITPSYQTQRLPTP